MLVVVGAIKGSPRAPCADQAPAVLENRRYARRIGNACDVGRPRQSNAVNRDTTATILLLTMAHSATMTPRQ